MTVYYLFLNSFWLWQTELFILQSIFAVSIVLLEIPTGFVSDKYSRKLSLMLWTLFGAGAYFFYSFGDGLFWFAMAEVFMAVWYCLISGTDTSLIYDSLKQLNQEAQYKKISGKVSSISLFAESVGGLVWAFVASYSLVFPFYLDAIACLIAFWLTFFLTEPDRDKFTKKESDLNQVWSVLKYSFQHKKIFWLIVFGGVFSTITIMTVWFSQPFMHMVNLPIAYFGVFWFASNMLWALFGLFIHQVEIKIWEKFFPYFTVLFCIVCLVVIWLFPNIRILPVFFLFQFVRQCNRLISSANLHLISKSETRATIQSISSMFFRFCFAVVWPVFGYISTHYSISTSFFLIAIVLGGVSLWTAYKLQNTQM